jgi:hypothetical protein
MSTAPKLYGLLHDPAGNEILRQVRTMKVAFGLPKGGDVHVWIGAQDKWYVQGGNARRSGRLAAEAFEKRTDAQLRYVALRKDFDDLVKKAKDPKDVVKSYPQKIPYFTFLRLGMGGDYVHDFDAIEQHGPIPSEIDIVFLTDQPFDYSYGWYTEARLNCRGDGMVGRRHIEAAVKLNGDKAAADAAAARGERYFEVRQCFVSGCPMAEKKMCKPHGRLFFQLVNQPRFGGTVTYDTTGFRSVSQLYSCIRELKAVTGHGDPDRGYIAGIPLKLVMRPYKVTHDGKQGVQYGVSLEYRAANAVELRRMLVQQGQEFRTAIAPEGRERLRIAAPADGAIPADAPIEDADAPYMDAEFCPDDGPDYDDGDPDPGDDVPTMPADSEPAKTEGK